MHELTLEELSALLNLFHRAGGSQNAIEADLLARIEALHGEKEELAALEFDDCLGGACKL
ncbi:MAG: hypothetical protein SVU24_03020 [Pseudomonadota bacterium]|jgi:hypothetical protein|nr:hypothetical protein [Pseudomonadota bacterium]